jgi:hypothetical protein
MRRANREPFILSVPSLYLIYGWGECMSSMPESVFCRQNP